eukprot:CAMPEP_0167759548 /NCGR_PEP_ID=MMETSP0110_2-20121227/11087_1 /TAXON_ID=629695 /ORGANISM="Gymnochlora sp., Strain CCMP2014" /LENGTH=2075 /DNA_ID=CAMNT_0007645951 /DNA_START=90 /DNA_END=6317 /DNA_ORIENTATION=+
MLGHRFPRLWNSIVGATVGWAGMLWFVTYNTSWDEVPIMLSLLGTLMGGLLGVVLNVMVSGITLGYCVAILVIVSTGELLFSPAYSLIPAAFILLMCMLGLVYGIYYRASALILASALSGGLVATTAIDVYGDQKFLRLSTMYTIFTVPGAKLPTVCTITCVYMLGLWGVIALMGLVVQAFLYWMVPPKYDDLSDHPHHQGHVWESMGGRTQGGSKYLKRAEQSFGRLNSLNADERLHGEAKFNYFSPEEMDKPMRTLYASLSEVFTQVQKRFGFQSSNRRNQQEHLFMLILNHESRLRLKDSDHETSRQQRENTAIREIHDKTFQNYVKWCDHLNIAKDFMTSNRITYLENLALFLMIWGEAGSVRHMPEALCFLTYNMLKEMRMKTPTQRDSGSFLRYVIKPIYSVIRADTRDIHTKRRNYDDINEFFWKRSCLDYLYCDQEYSLDTAESHDENEHLSVGLLHAEKTFLETKSWMQVINTFFPLINFYVVSFHMLVCLAVVLSSDQHGFSSRHHDNVILMSFVLTLSCMLIFRELLELYVSNGKINAPEERVGVVVRTVIKSGFALVLCYFFYLVLLCGSDPSEKCADNWRNFLIASGVFLLPYGLKILTVMFPIFGRFGNRVLLSRRLRWLTAVWWPETESYVGNNIEERDGQYFQYQLFWVLLVTWKMILSYNFQVVPCINPTLWIWAQFHYFSAPTRLLFIFITWAPFFIVYFFDMYIWYAVWQGLTGMIVGMYNRIGQIQNFSLVPSLFEDFPSKLGEKFFQTKIPHALPAIKVNEKNPRQDTLLNNHIAMETKSKYGSLDSNGIRKVRAHVRASVRANWHRFAKIWNEMIMDIRRADLMSNQERFIFSFNWVQIGNGPPSFHTPLFVSTATINPAMSFIAQSAEAFQEARGNGTSRENILVQFKEYFTQPTHREAIAEMWQLSVGLVQALIPVDSKSGISNFAVFAKALEDLALDEHDPYNMLLYTVKLQNFSGVKDKLARLVRAARLARGAWKKHRKAGRKNKAKHLTVSEGSMKRNFSWGTLRLQDRMARHGTEIDKHLKLLREQLIALLKQVQGVLVKSETGRDLSSKLDAVINDVNNTARTTEEHMRRLDDFFLDPSSAIIIDSLYTFMTVSNEFVPNNTSARRRILFFCNSLFMDIPEAPPIENMHSLSTLTPFYSEDVLYSKAYLQRRTKQGFSILLYLQTVYRPEWHNFCERFHIKEADRDASILEWASPKLQLEIRLWATRRGQTLFRTVDGMMLYEKAIRTLSDLEDLPGIAADLRDAMDVRPKGERAEIKRTKPLPNAEFLAKLKYQYVVSCQVYGRQKEEGDPKAADIEFLLRKFPNLRVAFIDNKKEEVKIGQTESKYYSCLIKASPTTSGDIKDDDIKRSKIAQRNGETDDEWDDDDMDKSKIELVYQIELPGNPIIGEGKPENQNHAIIFTRGEFVQAIDMNQEGYFEEAVKMRNLLEEFDRDDSRKATTIVGFREHIFTGGLSSVANYMAMQEGCFVSLGQRVLHDPLKIRLHYGHPDVFDKLFYMTRGGVSKASKGINLSEDIFAGYNTVLRGGHVSFKEYIVCGKGRDVGLQQLYKFEGKLACGNAMQALTRDMYRLCRALDFLKLMSFFYGGIGFYISTLLAVWGLYAFCYQRVIIAAVNLSMPKSFVGIDTVGYWIGTMGVLLTLPIICSIALERGVWKACYKVSYMLISGGPLFFMFHMGTKAHYFARTILSGGAKYRPTGRGFVADHTKFAELFRFYHQSHFSGAIEMVMLLILYGIFDRRVKHYWAVTWCAWVIVLSWLFAPLWLTPMMFEWENVVNDAKDFVQFMARPEGNGSRCWKTWYKEEIAFIDKLPMGSKLVLAIVSLRHMIVAISIFWYCSVGPTSPVVLGCAGIMVMLMGFYLLQNRTLKANQLCFFRGLRAVYVTIVLMIIAALLIISPPSKGMFKLSLLVFVGLAYIMAAFCSVCLALGQKFVVVQQLWRMYDYMVGIFLLGTVGLMSLSVVPAWIQTRLLFHNAFSQGVLIDDIRDILTGTLAKIGKNSEQVEIKSVDKKSRTRSRSYKKDDAKPPRGDRPIPSAIDASLISKSQ